MRWQFSILGLLALTAVVAVYLTFANHFPRLAVGFFIGGGIWALFLLVGNALLVGTGPRFWPLVGLIARMFGGTLFLLISLMIFSYQQSLLAFTGDTTRVLGMSMAGGAVICYLGAARSFLLWARARSGNGKVLPVGPDKSPR